jgi:4-amino-4-deoxy-L-arabinose transferase-like glycosyltransferase
MQGWLWLLCVAGALGCGAIAYQHLWTEFYPWWRFLLELGTGAVLLGVAVGNGARPPAESRVRRGLRWVAGLVAVGAVGLGTYYGTLHGRDISAVVAGCVALLAFLLARWVPFADADIRGLTGGPADTTPRRAGRSRWPVLLAVAGVGLGVAACYVNVQAHHLAAFLLWLSSLAVFALGMHAASEAPATDSASPWLGDGGPQLSRRDEAIALFLILALALALRLPLLADVPALIDSDEGRQGRYAERVWQSGFPDAFAFGWNGFAALSFMGTYLGAQLLGPSNMHLRLSAVVTGMVSLVPVFYWVRRWWGNVIGLLAVFILAICHEHVYWSRVAFNNIQAVLVATLMLATFARALQARRLIDWVWFGYATGLGLHTYHAAKLFPALLAAAALLYAAGMPGFLRRYWRGALAGALACLLCGGPLLVTIYSQWAYLYHNTSNRLDLSVLMEAYHGGDVEAVRNYLGSHVNGTLMSFVNVPWRLGTFDPFLCVTFLLGTFWMLWRWRDPRHVVVLGWVAGIAILGSMLTSYPPNKPRLVGLLPAVCVIPAVVAGRIRAMALRYFPARGDVAFAPLLAAWLGAAAYHNWWTEFVYRVDLNRADVMTRVCRLIEHTQTPAAVYMAGEPEPMHPRMAIGDCMIADNPDRVIVNLADDPRLVPLPPQHRGNAVLMLSPSQRGLLPLVQHYYPDARVDTVYTREGDASFYMFTIPESMVEQHRGVRVVYRSPARTWAPAGGSDVGGPPEGADFPLAATWRGQVWVEPPGAYHFRSPGAALRIDGRPTDGSGPLELPAGWHLLELTATFERPADRFTLEWLPAWGNEWTPIARNFLNTHPQAHGLLGRYFTHAVPVLTPEPIPEAPAATQIEAALSFDWFKGIDDPPPPYFAQPAATMEWVGSVDVPEGTDQTVRLESSDPTQVFVNGVLVLASTGEPDARPAEATLPGLTGRVPILVRTTRSASPQRELWKLRLLWRDADGGWTAFAPYHPPWNGAAGGAVKQDTEGG